MTLQASVRVIVHGERTLFARTAVMFAGAVADRYRDTVATFMGALAQSRRREAERRSATTGLCSASQTREQRTQSADQGDGGIMFFHLAESPKVPGAPRIPVLLLNQIDAALNRGRLTANNYENNAA
jgi:hypothetical protein